MNPITVIQYLGPYADHPDASSEKRGTAARLLDKINAGLALAEADGVVLPINPHTGCHIAGNGNGGFRPQICVDADGKPIGAGGSQHKDAHAGDIHDPLRELCAWSLRNKDRLRAIGIRCMENPQYTPTWCHWQDVDVHSGNFSFIPSRDAVALSPALPEQLGHA